MTKWLKGDDYYLHTEDDNWRISKALSASTVFYTLWKKRDERGLPPYALIRTVNAPTGDIDARNKVLRDLQDAAE
jgi:hypothetical protein